MAGALLASRMEQKINQELFNVSLSPPTFIGDSEIILKMIAKNDPAGNPVFYGVRLMEILAVSSPNNWFWCPGNLNPADLLTRSGTSCAKVNSEFWLNGSFLPQDKSSWPIIPCSSITSGEIPTRAVNLVKLSPDNPSCKYILSLLHHEQSLSTIIRALNLLHKVCRS